MKLADYCHSVTGQTEHSKLTGNRHAMDMVSCLYF